MNLVLLKTHLKISNLRLNSSLTYSNLYQHIIMMEDGYIEGNVVELVDEDNGDNEVP